LFVITIYSGHCRLHIKTLLEISTNKIADPANKAI
jgi:hypothetical protein